MGLKYYSNEKFFETWTPTMAYILGYFYADGGLEDASYLRGKYFRVTSTDKALINLVKSSLSSKHKIITIKSPNPKWKTRYFLRIGSHKIYSSLVKLGLHPNKSLTMRLPKIPKKLLSHFVRGYFDGDGHVSIEVNNGTFKRVKIIFVSGSKNFLNDLAQELNAMLDLRIRKVYEGWRSYRLSYSTSDSVKIFKYIYKDADGLFLKRKYNIFKKFFSKYSKWADEDVSKIIQ